jgi:hypothetical protein
VSGNWQLTMPSPDAYWMGKVLYDIHHRPGDLEIYLKDPAAYLAPFPLSDELKAAIREDNIGRMYLAGVNPYLLRAHCIGLRIPEAVFTASLAAVRN